MRKTTSLRNSKQTDFQNTLLKANQSNLKNEALIIYDNDSSKKFYFQV